MPPLRAEPLVKPVKSFLHNLVRMHTGSFMDLCLDDTTDDMDRLQRYCDQLALAAGLRLSFTYGSCLTAMNSFLVIETNFRVYAYTGSALWAQVLSEFFVFESWSSAIRGFSDNQRSIKTY